MTAQKMLDGIGDWIEARIVPIGIILGFLAAAGWVYWGWFDWYWGAGKIVAGREGRIYLICWVYIVMGPIFLIGGFFGLSNWIHQTLDRTRTRDKNR